MTALLTREQVSDALSDLPLWSGDTSGITSTHEFPSFPEAIVGVAAVGALAERLDHHPDMDIRWRSVTFAVATHSEGGVTAKDVELAAGIDRVIGRQTPQ